MKSDIGAGGAGAMESFGIITRGEDLPISKCDFVTGDVRLVEVVERSRGRGSGDEGHEIADRNDFVGVLMVIVALLYVRRE